MRLNEPTRFEAERRYVGIAIGALLAIGALAVIVWPFIRRRSPAAHGDLGRTRQHGDTHVTQPQAELRRARGEIYRLIRQLEADHSAGLVNDQDFRSQFDGLRGEAARLMMDEAALTSMSDPAAELEREIAAARAGLVRRPVESGRKDA